MSEPKAEYNIDTRPVEIRCTNCNHPLRAMVHRINGTEVLVIGALVLSEAHGICTNCGAGFHFDISQKALAKFIQYLPGKT